MKSVSPWRRAERSAHETGCALLRMRARLESERAAFRIERRLFADTFVTLAGDLGKNDALLLAAQHDSLVGRCRFTPGCHT